MPLIHPKRIERLRQSLQAQSLDALLVLSEPNRRYLSNFSAKDGQCNESAGTLLITQTQLLILTDSRYLLEAKQDAPGFTVREYPKGRPALLPELCRKFDIRHLGIETSRLPYTQFTQFQEQLASDPNVTLLPIANLVEHQRRIKDETEINSLRKALHLSEQAFLLFLDEFNTGYSEKEAAWLLEKQLRQHGAEALSFPIIAAAGANAALPHATPSETTFQAGACALFDFGGQLNGYCADITCTFSPKKMDDSFFKAFTAVLTAQQKAIEHIRAGAQGQEIDAIARQYLAENGFAGKFTHSLGHGVGLDIHEAPRLSPLRNDTLEEGMVVTVEPGVYIENWGGIRLEQMVVVRKDYAEVLNQLSFEEILYRMLDAK